jgi:hypothetical protein
MNKEQMIDVIYDKIADKTISFGCLYEWENHHIEIFWKWIYRAKRQWQKITEEEFFEKDSKHTKIIWHPVMIGDCLDWIEKNTQWWLWAYYDWCIPSEDLSSLCIEWISLDNWKTFYWNLRKEKRKPIEYQSDECIEYIYNLIK